VGPVRQRQLIRLSSVLVALDLAVGLTAVYAHSTGAATREAGGRVEAGAPPASGGPPTTAGSNTSGGAPAAGHFARRRGFGTSSSTLPPPGPATTSMTPGAPITPAPGSTNSSTPPTTNRPPATSATAPGTDAPAPGTDAPAPGTATTAPGIPAPPPTTAPRATTTTTGTPPAGTPAAGTPGSGLVTDATGDTFIDGTQTHITEPRADIVKAVAAYDNGNISFALETQKADDPQTDPNWASDATYVAFDVDTTGDGKPDFEVQYSYDGTGFGGEVIHPGDDDSVPAVCDATAAGYTAPAYWITIDPSCLGNPSSFSFRVTTYFDTNPKDDNADVASDVAPNGGMSFAITRPS